MKYQFYFIDEKGEKHEAEFVMDRLIAERKERELNTTPSKRYWFEEERIQENDQQ